MNPVDIARSRCKHPRAYIEQRASKLYICTWCGELRGTMTTAEHNACYFPPGVAPGVLYGQPWTPTLIRSER